MLGTESQDDRESEYETDSELYPSYGASVEEAPSINSQGNGQGNHGPESQVSTTKQKEEVHNPPSDSTKSVVTTVTVNSKPVVPVSTGQSSNQRSDPVEIFPVSTAPGSVLRKIETKANSSKVASALKPNNEAQCSEKQASCLFFLLDY